VDYPYENRSPCSFVFTLRAIYKEMEKERLEALCDLSGLERSAREKRELEKQDAIEEELDKSDKGDDKGAIDTAQINYLMKKFKKEKEDFPEFVKKMFDDAKTLNKRREIVTQAGGYDLCVCVFCLMLGLIVV